MELRLILQRLLWHKAALGAVLAVAVALAWLAGSRSEVTTTGAATTQILIDAPQSALANLKQNTLPLTTRAGMFAQFMASTAVRESIAQEAGIPAGDILAKGPYDDPEAAPTGIDPGSAPSSATPPGYVLTFVAQEEVPVVTVYVQAPDAASASKLAGGVAAGVQRYVDSLLADSDLPQNDRVKIRGLGIPEGGEVTSGGAAPVMAGVFLVVTLLGCMLILMLYRRRDYDAAYGEEILDDDAVEEALAEPEKDWYPPAGVRS